ncbi:MAG: MltA domain-containing protein [Asticcacaulis sp.]
MKLRLGLAVALTLFVAACAERPVTPPVVTPPPSTPPVTPVTPPAETPNPVPQAARLSNLPGWQTSDAFIALEALRATCIYKHGRQYGDICAAMTGQDFQSPDEIRDFLDSHLQIVAIDGSGTMTGYFVPDYDGSYIQSDEFSQPVRPRPADLVYVAGSQMTPAQTTAKVAARKVGDTYVPYYTRADIEQMPVTTAYYMRPEDYFYMQLQGSGFLHMPDGKQVYAAYSADNGQPFVGIAKTMVQQGYLTSSQTSGDNIHAWLASHRGPDAQAVMNTDPRYAFFAIQPDQTEPQGAAGISLPPGSAIAIDPAFHDLGDLFWLDASVGGNALDNAYPVYDRLVSALDTGGAIKGNIRADLYVGHGRPRDRAGHRGRPHQARAAYVEDRAVHRQLSSEELYEKAMPIRKNAKHAEHPPTRR